MPAMKRLHIMVLGRDGRNLCKTVVPAMIGPVAMAHSASIALGVRVRAKRDGADVVFQVQK